jgi:hypothetical protein
VEAADVASEGPCAHEDKPGQSSAPLDPGTEPLRPTPVLADDDESRDALLTFAQGLAERIHARWLDIRSIRPVHPGLPVNERYVTFRKPLPADPAEVLGDLPRKARAAARQAQKNTSRRCAPINGSSSRASGRNSP